MLKTIFFILISIGSHCFASSDERRVALIIGNSQYSTMGTLSNATNDATDMAEALRGLEFEVISGTNLSKKQMREKIHLFDESLKKGTAENTIGLFYYAGHGLEVDGNNYLVPIDADMEYQEDARDEGVSLNLITSRMKYTKNRMNIVILDACRNNPFPKRDRAISSGGWGAMSNLASGMFIAYGTSPGRKAADSDGFGRNGLFTKHILNNIKKPGKTLEQVFKSTRAGVLDDSNGRQITWQNNATTGDFYFTSASLNSLRTNGNQTTHLDVPLLNDMISRSSNTNLSQTNRMTNTPAGQVFKDCDNCPEMITVDSGVFTMGRDDGHPMEGPSHLVSIAKFNLSTTEVTFAQWDACLKDGGCSKKPNDEGWGRNNRPVINISWNDAQQYILWLSQKTGHNYRLPSESEWEFAARAGSQKNFSWGDEVGINNANCKVCGSQWDNKQSAPVKSFKPNKFGLYDMHGNVMEFTQDCYHPHYYEAPKDQAPWITGKCESRMYRGGYWGSEAYFMWSLFRNAVNPSSHVKGMGFRVARN